MLKSKALAGMAVFAAMALLLNMAVKIPAPYASFLIYEIWEIPMVVAFLIFGAAACFGVMFINLIALQLIFPGQLITGPVYNLAAVMLMLLGMWLAGIFAKVRGVRTTVAAATVGGILTRTVGMNFIMGILMPLSPPIGFAIPSSVLRETLVLIAVFNGSVALYTVPVSYWIAGIVKPKSSMSSFASGAVSPLL